MVQFFFLLALQGGDAVVPGRFLVDPPTLENLGFRWIVDGDANRNATVRVAYRRKGEEAWREAMPLLRVMRERVNRDYGLWECGNLFAGSVLGLEPGTAYDVRLVMEDPDGGAAPEKIVTVTTRAVPRRPEGGKTIDVRPGDDVRKVFREAGPGDTLLFHPGVHRVSEFYPERSGEPARPIVFLGEDGAVLQGDDDRVTMVDVRNASQLWFENLTFRRARNAIRGGAGGAAASGKERRAGSGLVVVRCRFEDVITGIVTLSEYSENWYIADNVITGRNPAWYPRPKEGYMEPSHTGINVYGRGHVVMHNRVSRFGDGLAIANFGPPVKDPELHAVAIDFIGNDVSDAKDDCIEADYGGHNVRVLRNRCFNAHTGLSAQPFYGGPAYFVGNELYGITALPFKLHNWPAGLVIAHNTAVSARRAFQTAPLFQNTLMVNNLMLGTDGYTIDAGSPDTLTRLDHNGWRKSDDPVRFIAWTVNGNRSRYRTLEEFNRATGHGQHSMLVDYDVFEKAAPPKEGASFTPADWDLRLREGTGPVDAGMRLPNLNDGYAGGAPDLGCHERGRDLPRYGPR